jgi:Xaa-Pro aminopeptidase
MAQIKNRQEIELIKHACKLTDAIFERMKRNFVFKTEKELE